MKKYLHVERVAQFFAMVDAHMTLSSPEDPVTDGEVMFHFSGSGASDALTVGEIRAFMEEAKRLKAILDDLTERVEKADRQKGAA